MPHVSDAGESTSIISQPTVIVSSKGELSSALDNATAGDIVEIQGLIEVKDQIQIDTADLAIQAADENFGE